MNPSGMQETAVKISYSYRTKEWRKVQVWVTIAPDSFDKGAFRRVHKALECDRHGERHEVVCKFFDEELFERKGLGKSTKALYYDDIVTQSTAQHYAKEYNKQDPPKKVAVLDCWLLELVERPGLPMCFVEPQLNGQYVKYNDNWGGVFSERHTPQAFTHFTYEESDRDLVVVDVQGVGDIYTDPRLHSRKGDLFGLGDKGTEGIRKWVGTHNCSPVCLALNLPPPGVNKRPLGRKLDSDLSRSGSLPSSTSISIPMSGSSVEGNVARTPAHRSALSTSPISSTPTNMANYDDITGSPYRWQDSDLRRDDQLYQRERSRPAPTSPGRPTVTPTWSQLHPQLSLDADSLQPPNDIVRNTSNNTVASATTDADQSEGDSQQDTQFPLTPSSTITRDDEALRLTERLVASTSSAASTAIPEQRGKPPLPTTTPSASESTTAATSEADGDSTRDIGPDITGGLVDGASNGVSECSDDLDNHGFSSVADVRDRAGTSEGGGDTLTDHRAFMHWFNLSLQDLEGALSSVSRRAIHENRGAVGGGAMTGTNAANASAMGRSAPIAPALDRTMDADAGELRYDRARVATHTNSSVRQEPASASSSSGNLDDIYARAKSSVAAASAAAVAAAAVVDNNRIGDHVSSAASSTTGTTSATALFESGLRPSGLNPVALTPTRSRSSSYSSPSNKQGQSSPAWEEAFRPVDTTSNSASSTYPRFHTVSPSPSISPSNYAAGTGAGTGLQPPVNGEWFC